MNCPMRIITILLALLLSCAKVSGKNGPADAAYQARNYAQAAQLYREALQKAPHADLYYNLGNASWRLKDTAQAILNYQRALWMEPSHKDARHNLDICRHKLADQFDPPGEMFFTTLFRNLVQGQSSAFWAGMALLAFAVGGLGWMVRRFCHKNSLQTLGASLLWAGVAFVIVFNLFSLWRHHVTTHENRGVVMETLPVYPVAHTQKDIIRHLHAGTTLTILETHRGWQKVQMPDGKEGWTTGKVEPIRPKGKP